LDRAHRLEYRHGEPDKVREKPENDLDEHDHAPIMP
jgi:hypothetical protein